MKRIVRILDWLSLLNAHTTPPPLIDSIAKSAMQI